MLRVHVWADDLIDAAGAVDPGRIDFPPAVRGTITYECGSPNVCDFLDGLTASQAVGHLDDRAFRIAVEQKISGGIKQDRAAHDALPIVEMSNSAQGGFNAAEDDRHIAIRFLTTL